MFILIWISTASAGTYIPPRCPLGDSPTSEPNSVSLYTDQDWFQLLAPQTDRNYTMGFGLGFGGDCAARLSAPLNLMNHGLDKVVSWVGAEEEWFTPAETDYTLHQISVLGAGYTPFDLRADDPVIGDRPYASLLLLHWQQISWDPGGDNRNRYGTVKSARVTEFSLGALGLPVSPFIQTWIHDVMQANNGCVPYDETDEENCQPFRPDGWDHQISDGGEVTARYGYTWLNLLLEIPGRKHHTILDLSARRQVEGGYYTGFNGGLTMRLGWVNDPFWATLMASPLGGVQEAGDTPSRPLLEAYAFASGGGRFVAYNALLQGQFRPSDYTLTYKDISKVIGRYDVGAVARVGPVRFTYIVGSGRTRELMVGDGHSHAWGTAGVNVTWPVRGLSSGSPEPSGTVNTSSTVDGEASGGSATEGGAFGAPFEPTPIESGVEEEELVPSTENHNLETPVEGGESGGEDE